MKIQFIRILLIHFFSLITAFLLLNPLAAQTPEEQAKREESWEKGLQLFKEIKAQDLGSRDSAIMVMGVDSISAAIGKSDSVFFHYVIAVANLLDSYDETRKVNAFLESTLKERLQEDLLPQQRNNYLASLASTYNNIGYIASTEEDIEKATEYQYKSLEIRERLGDSLGMISCLNSIGVYYFNVLNLEKAAENWLKALALGEGKPDVYGESLVATYRYLFNYYNRKERFEESEDVLKKGKELAVSLNKTLDIGLYARELGVLYMRKEKFPAAYQELEKALEITQEYGAQEMQAMTLFDMAEVAQKMNWRSELEKLAGIAQSLLKEARSPQVREECYFVLFLRDEINENFQRALLYYQQWTQLRDSLEKERVQTNLVEQELEYEYGKKALADSLEQVKILEVKEQVNRRQRSGLVFLIIGLILTLIFGAILWNRFRLTRSQKQVIEEEKEKLDAANAKLKELDNFKSRFFTNISHEFRTPLTVIKGMNQQIRQQPESWLEKGTELIERNTSSLLHLINQILDLRKLESGNLSLRPVQVDVIHVLRISTASFESLAESKDIKLEFQAEEQELLMDVDPEKLGQITNNLLSNALKFTQEGGQISLHTFRQSDSQLSIVVKDSGRGIPAEKLPYIFDRFYQVDGTDTRVGEGTGVGLSLTKELVQLMGGEIGVESSLGQGTTFTIFLPIQRQTTVEDAETLAFAKESLLPTPQPIPPQAGADLPRLLIIEDNPDIVEYLYACLEGQYQLSAAPDGQAGIDLALEQAPDLIISDVMMPRKNGYEVCDILKQDLRTSHIPILLLTAKADQPSRLEGYKRGADAYLAKPFDREELQIRLANLLENQQRLQARYSESTNPPPSEQAEQRVEDEFVAKVRQMILDRLDDPEFGVDQMYTELGLGRTSFYRKVKALTGHSVSYFVRAVRVEQAQHLLVAQPELQVAEVAYATGFSDPAYFTRVFKGIAGLSPGGYREEQIEKKG